MARQVTAAGLLLCSVMLPLRLEAARCDPLPLPAKGVRTVRSTSDLIAAVQKAQPDSTIVLEDGVYELPATLDIRVPGLTLRGRSADPVKTVIKGSGMIGEGVGVGVALGAPRVTIAHLSIGLVRFHSVQVRGEAGAQEASIYGVRLFDAGQQLLKGSFAPNGRTADQGRIECSTFEYSDHAPSSYTDGVDLIGVKGWIIRDNRFIRIRGPQEKGWSAGPAILAWGNSEGTLVERNVVIDCFRGIALGMGPGVFKQPRGGPTQVDHRGGVIRNNVVMNLNAWGNEGIEVNAAPDARVEYNTVVVEGSLPWSISIRFPESAALVRNNLTSRRILSRNDGKITAAGNVEGAAQSWFVDIAAGNLRLSDTATTVIDAGVVVDDVAEDFDGLPRSVGERPDAGAFEYQADRR